MPKSNRVYVTVTCADDALHAQWVNLSSYERYVDVDYIEDEDLVYNWVCEKYPDWLDYTYTGHDLGKELSEPFDTGFHDQGSP